MQTGTKAPRRRHADELKARVLAACAEPVASVAAVVQAHALNANLVHKWWRGCGFFALTLPATAIAAPATNGQPMTTPAADIRIEWRRGSAAIVVSWPVSAAPECARWLAQCMGRSDPHALDLHRRPVAGHPAYRHAGRRGCLARPCGPRLRHGTGSSRLSLRQRGPAASSCWCTTASGCGARPGA